MKQSVQNLMLLSVFIYTAECLAAPKYIFVIRHGEKTEKNQVVDFEQWHLPKSKPLDARGWQRAFALAPHFTKQPQFTKYGKIVALFAPKPNKDYESVRPIQTITPLSHVLNMPIQHHYGLEDVCLFVKHIMTEPAYNGKTILIAYEHHHIPGLGAALQGYAGCQHSKNHISIPTGWNNNVFDRVWTFTLDPKTGEVVNFENLPQHLLFGDSKK